MLVPMIDHLTDIYYVLVEAFHNFALFFLAATFLVASSGFFVYELYTNNAYPCLWYPSMLQHTFWLGCDLEKVGSHPTINGHKSPLSFDEHDNPIKLIWFLLFWIICIVLQLITPFAVLC